MVRPMSRPSLAVGETPARNFKVPTPLWEEFKRLLSHDDSNPSEYLRGCVETFVLQRSPAKVISDLRQQGVKFGGDR